MYTTETIKLKSGIRVVDRGKRIDFHIPGGDSITINSSAAEFYRALNSENTVGAAIKKMTEEYDVSEAELNEDAEEFLNNLCEYGVIEIE